MKKESRINDNAMLRNIRESKGCSTHLITSVLDLDGKRANVTYDIGSERVIIHEWYNIGYSAAMSLLEPIRACMRDLVA